jgi:hypothetical protein
MASLFDQFAALDPKRERDQIDAGVSGGGVSPSNVNPTMDGTAVPGVSLLYSRGDHVHPSDTSRAPLASPTFTGTPQAPTPATTDSTTNLATTAFVNSAALLKTGGALTGSLIINSSQLQINPPTGTASIVLAPQSATNGINIYLKKNGSGAGVSLTVQNVSSTRWVMNIGDAVPESGSNAGSNFVMQRFDDSGAFLGNGLSINRATGNVTLVGSIGVNGTAAPVKPTVTGAKGSNTALASLLAALVSYGLIVDSTTA